MNRSLRILSLSLSLSSLVVEARAASCSKGTIQPSVDCKNAGVDKNTCATLPAVCRCEEGCTSDAPLVKFITGCRWYAGKCEPDSKPLGPIGVECKCKATSEACDQNNGGPNCDTRLDEVS